MEAVMGGYTGLCISIVHLIMAVKDPVKKKEMKLIKLVYITCGLYSEL